MVLRIILFHTLVFTSSKILFVLARLLETVTDVIFWTFYRQIMIKKNVYSVETNKK